MSFDGTLATSSWPAPPAHLNEETLLRQHEQHMREHHMQMLEQQQFPNLSPRTPDTTPLSRSASFSTFGTISPPRSPISRSASFCSTAAVSTNAVAVPLFSQRGGASCLVQQLSLSRTIAAGTQQDFVGQIAIGLRSDSAEERENACSALVNICSKGNCLEFCVNHLLYFTAPHHADGMSQFVMDIALPPLASVILMPDSAKKPILRHAAIVLVRLAEDRDIAAQMHLIPGVSDAIILLVRAPLACVWRNALRAALLMSYHSSTSFAPFLLRAGAFPQIVRMLNSDQLELRFDGIRGVRGLAQAPGGCQVLLEQPEILEWVFRLCLTTKLAIEFEHTAATTALLLASAPDARARLVSTIANAALQSEDWKPLRSVTATFVTMMEGLLAEARLLMQEKQGQQQQCVGAIEE